VCVEIEFMDVFKELIASFIATLPVKEQTASVSKIVAIYTTVNWCHTQKIIRIKDNGLSDSQIIFYLC